MKKMNNKHSLLSFLTVVMLLAAMLMMMISCDSSTQGESSALGTKNFKFEVVFANGSTDSYDITTDKKTVGEALISENLISGEDSQYGLYVMTVCGEYHKYEEDGKYWAFYVNGEYGMAGVDQTDIEDGAVYCFKAE